MSYIYSATHPQIKGAVYYDRVTALLQPLGIGSTALRNTFNALVAVVFLPRLMNYHGKTAMVEADTLLLGDI